MATLTYVKFNSLAAAMPNKVHNFASDQLVVALTNSAPTASNTVLANITQISYTNCSSRNITTTSSTQTSGTYSLVLVDLTLTASGTVGPFRYIVIYNDTATNDELVAYYDIGSNITLASGESYLLDFSQSQTLFELV